MHIGCFLAWAISSYSLTVIIDHPVVAAAVTTVELGEEFGLIKAVKAANSDALPYRQLNIAFMSTNEKKL